MNVGGFDGQATAYQTPTPQTPGYYFVTYTYELSNPLGSGAQFSRGAPVGLNDVRALERSTSAVVVSSARPELPMGTVLAVERQGVYAAGSVVTDTTGLVVIPFYQGLAPTN